MSKVLVVDDNPDVVDLLSMILETNGYSVDTASGGEECLQLLKQREYDLVFIDIMMPRLRGDQVAERIRKEASTKIVFVTIKNKGEVPMKLADAFIKKPFGVEDILKAARKYAG